MLVSLLQYLRYIDKMSGRIFSKSCVVIVLSSADFAWCLVNSRFNDPEETLFRGFVIYGSVFTMEAEFSKSSCSFIGGSNVKYLEFTVSRTMPVCLLRIQGERA